MAQKATRPQDRQAWQALGETWRDMVLPFERTPAIEPPEQACQELSTLT